MKIGFIGLGKMGTAMATRLLSFGHEVIAYNRSPEKLADLTRDGARPAASIRDLTAEANIVISMLANDSALHEVAMGPNGLIACLPSTGIHVAMGTHDVQGIRSLSDAHRAAGQTLLSAPVLGRPEAVTAGRLAVIVGGDPTAIETCRPVLQDLGRKLVLAGADPGSAAALKLANNFLLACAIEALGEAFSLVEKSGVDRSVFQELVTDVLFDCPAYKIYSGMIAGKNWDQVGFTVALALKDVNLVLAAGQLGHVPLPSANVCRDRLLGAIAHGDADRDWSAMALEQARASGLA